MRALQRWSLRLNRAAYYLSCTVLLLLLAMTVTNVLGRYLFARPVRGTVELTELAMAAIVFLALGYAQHRGDHVVVDLVYNRFPRWLRHAARWVIGVLTLALMLLMIWRVFEHALTVHERGRITSVLGLPVFPAVVLSLAGLVLFTLALVTTLLTAHRAETAEAKDEGEP